MENKELSDYVKQSRAAGVPDGDIIGTLLGIGWDSPTVDKVLRLSSDLNTSNNWGAVLGGIVMLLCAGVLLLFGFFATVFSADGGVGEAIGTFVFFAVIVIALGVSGVHLIFKGLRIKKIWTPPSQPLNVTHSRVFSILYSFILAAATTWLAVFFTNIIDNNSPNILAGLGGLFSFPVGWVAYYLVFSRSYSIRQQIYRSLAVFISVLLVLALPQFLFARFVKAPSIPASVNQIK